MTAGWRILIVICCLGVGMLPGFPGAHVTATGLAVVAVNGRDVSFRLTVVPSELPEAASQLLSGAMAGSRPDAERLAEHRAPAQAATENGARRPSAKLRPLRPGPRSGVLKDRLAPGLAQDVESGGEGLLIGRETGIAARHAGLFSSRTCRAPRQAILTGGRLRSEFLDDLAT
jgi:hypothetical protein